ncbi:MAG: AmmeMemoRadiSam system protein B [Candidatus Zixiibacteriota bacterium]
MRNLIIFLAFLAIFSTSDAATKREAVVAGTFYPADSAELAQLVQKHLDNVTDLPEIDGQIIALIVPHAGLEYSGQIAAYSYKLLENTPIKNLFICAPSHKFPFNGLSVYGPYIKWTIPLGTVKCSIPLGMEMIRYNKDEILHAPEPHMKEHSIEVQLPYIKTVIKESYIIPVVMGIPNQHTIDLLEGALNAIEFDSTMVMIAATDWQHYRPAKEGWLLDSLGIACLEELNPERLNQLIEKKEVEACGGGPTVAVLRSAIKRGANRVKILKYGDSGDVTGDKASVVGYIAAVIYKANEPADKKKSESGNKAVEENLPNSSYLSESDKKELLQIARSSISEYLQTGHQPDFDVPDKLKELGAGFVTLEIDNNLRGCIGYTEAFMPLYQTISDCAIKAAVADRRFRPVKADELGNIHIEISVLTPLQKIKDIDEIEVGRDGLMISLNGHRGLLLPQVASEWKWDRITFLQQTCLKAGLPSDAYLEESADIYKFQALIFGEGE